VSQDLGPEVDPFDGLVRDLIYRISFVLGDQTRLTEEERRDVAQKVKEGMTREGEWRRWADACGEQRLKAAVADVTRKKPGRPATATEAEIIELFASGHTTRKSTTRKRR
jgi:hypothetical protein